MTFGRYSASLQQELRNSSNTAKRDSVSGQVGRGSEQPGLV